MSLNAAAGTPAVSGGPLANTPRSKLTKWKTRIKQISAEVESKGDMITPEKLGEFFRVLEL